MLKLLTEMLLALPQNIKESCSTVGPIFLQKFKLFRNSAFFHQKLHEIGYFSPLTLIFNTPQNDDTILVYNKEGQIYLAFL